MNLSDITKINFGTAGISAVYNGGIKLWPTGTGESNKVMKFTIVSGDTWNKTTISAYTADNRLITPVSKDTTGWTFDEDVEYLTSNYGPSNNLLTFEGFPKAVKLKSGRSFFSNNTKCTDISTANMDFSECTDMGSMFNSCYVLASLDVSNWDTSKVTDMGSMFSNCRGLTSLDLSNFNTSNVTNMGYMFSGCRLISLDLSNWSTPKLISMSKMFNNCSKLASLDVSKFDTSKITDMQYLFINCSKLASLDLSNFNTSQVTNMNSMFMGCTSLTTLDLSNWDTSKVTSIDGMFTNCSALKTVKMTNCSQDTKDKIRAALDAAGLTSTVITE